jgi:hypothetical protein
MFGVKARDGVKAVQESSCIAKWAAIRAFSSPNDSLNDSIVLQDVEHMPTISLIDHRLSGRYADQCSYYALLDGLDLYLLLFATACLSKNHSLPSLVICLYYGSLPRMRRLQVSQWLHFRRECVECFVAQKNRN